MGDSKQLYVIFNSDFLDSLKVLGNSMEISYYYLEDVRKSISNPSALLNYESGIVDRYNNDQPLDVFGYWDQDRKELKIHLELGKYTYSNVVRDTSDTEDPKEFEYDYKNNFGIHEGDKLVRVIRFTYNNNERDTAFIITSDIKHSSGGIILEPIRCDQDKIIITVEFPETTQANIRTKKIEKDTEFLEGPGIARGLNIFRAVGEESLSTRKSAFKYMGAREPEILKKDVPYLSDSGRLVYRRDRIRIYTSLEIFCPGLLQNIRPKTRASLNINGGVLRIYGTLNYLEYEAKGTELIYVGAGSEALEGIPDYELILTEHEKGLKDPVIENRVYVRYGKYEEQPDPSVLVKARIEFWNPFEDSIEVLESANIRLTQEENVISQWEVIYRSSEYTENLIPVYLFPWRSGYEHTFTIRTTFPDLRIAEDFEIEYSNSILQNYFRINIERIPSRTYPITDYKVTIISLIDNLDPLLWLPIIDSESELLLTTIRLKDYDYTESFYYVQSPKSESLELQDSNNNVIHEITLEYNQERAEFYPVAPDTRTQEEILPKNTWIIIDYDHNALSFESEFGPLNTPENLEHKLILNAPNFPQSIENLDLGKIVLGRIKESEIGNSFTDWRSLVSLYTISIPISKRGLIESLNVPDSVLLEEISLYPIRIISNGSFACWMEESDDYCFFDPRTNTITNSNHYYSRDFNSTSGIDIYLALHNTTILDTEPYLDNKIFVSVVEREPDWENFEPTGDLGMCKVYRKGVENPRLNYLDPIDSYVFLDSDTSTSIKLRSSETPIVDRLQILENQYTNQHQLSYNNITLLDSLDPVFSVADNYRYHLQHVQNPNNLSGYYPISPCCIYTVHSYNYPDLTLPFYLFRKALGPSFYRTDSSTGNIIYVNSTVGPASITVRSRYEILQSELETLLNDEGAFEITSFECTTLETNDYKYRYTIGLNIRLANTGWQRPLGDILITSRIYDLVNFTSSDNVDIEYLELTQDEIDKIVPPATMKISIIQLSGGGEGNPDEIELSGNRGGNVSNSGETRGFRIFSEIPINEPSFSNLTGEGLDIVDRSIEGFTVKIPPIVSGYRAEVPSDSDTYTQYTERKDLSFDLTIQPADSNSNIAPYRESFIFKQNGISRGLVFATPDDIPKLYLGTNSISYTVDSRTTSLNIFLGAFDIRSRISDGARGITEGIEIETQNSYFILSGDCEYQTTSWTPTVRLEFPQNLGARVVDRVFTITYNNSGVTHKITLTVKQVSGEGNIVCSDNAYFLSHGECIEHGPETDYEDLGFFTFETDLDIRTLSLDIPEALYESYSFISTGTPSRLSGNYKTYKAQIKLKPNLSNSIIKNQIFSFLKDGERIKNVYINQGYYSLLLCKPGYTDVGVYSGGTLGDIEVPTRNNTSIGTQRLFYVVLNRQEPIPETGTFTDREEVIFPEITNLLYVSSYTWAILDLDNDSNGNRTTSNTSYLTYYESVICPNLTDETIEYPYLENKYRVNTSYYTTEIPIKVTLSILANYPTDDPLFWLYRKTTEHSYTIYLLKTADPW